MSEQVLNTISFAGRAAASNQFKTLYTEGMTLVEETASYLDGATALPQRFCRVWRPSFTPRNRCASPPV